MSVSCRVTWGLAGVAEEARLLPASTLELVKQFEASGIELEVPDFTDDQIAYTKDPTWLLPILQIAHDLSLGVISGALLTYLQQKFGRKSGRRVRVVVQRTDLSDGSVQKEWRLEGDIEEVAAELEKLEE